MQRVPGEDEVDISSPAARSRRDLLATLACICVYVASSSSITFMNNAMLNDMDFHFPFTVSAVNNSAIALIAYALTRHPALRQPQLRPAVYARVAVPIGVATALDVGTSNASLIYLSVSFHTMIKATVPAFVLLFGFLLGLEKGSLLTCASVLLVVSGISIAASDELVGVADLDAGGSAKTLLGFFLGLTSAALSALRWSLTQLLIKGAPASGGGPCGASCAAAEPPPQPSFTSELLGAATAVPLPTSADELSRQRRAAFCARREARRSRRAMGGRAARTAPIAADSPSATPPASLPASPPASPPEWEEESGSGGGGSRDVASPRSTLEPAVVSAEAALSRHANPLGALAGCTPRAQEHDAAATACLSLALGASRAVGPASGANA